MGKTHEEPPLDSEEEEEWGADPFEEWVLMLLHEEAITSEESDSESEEEWSSDSSQVSK